MHVINVNNITINHAGRLIFEGLSWVVGDRDRVGLVGPNGAGKSSLLKALAGDYVPDAGSIVRARGISVGYLPQTVNLTPDCPLIDEAMRLPPALAQVEHELGVIEGRLSDPAVYGDETALASALAEQERVLERYTRLGGALHANRVRELLAHLGFTPGGSRPAD